MASMNTKGKLEYDMKEAMRNKDKVRKRTLRMALSEIKFAEVEKGDALDEAEIFAILQKEVKSRREAIADAELADRPDLVVDAKADITILEAYLPQPLTSDELEALAQEAIEEVGATSMREMGQVMKVLMPRLEGRATGQEASQAVRKLLS
ncbi:MAG: GatB/YqeY domain-containing protein [Anaerolineales bacterium]|nr:GatB/YqeY domain-containing protein [Anaerolineales bacterium]